MATKNQNIKITIESSQMSVKLSNSARNVYLECPKSYQYKYKEKLVSLYRGSALFFGVAMDEAQNYILTNRYDKNVLKKAIKIFEEHWESQTDKKGEVTTLPYNPYIQYSKYDFDSDLLTKADWKALFKLAENPMGERRHIEDLLKTTEFKDLIESQRVFYNFSSWLCLLRKGPIMLKAYVEQLLPNIEEVQEVQKELVIKDDDGNEITGIVDFTAKLVGHTNSVVADNKTSSIEYDDDSVATSAQLAQYKEMLNKNYGYNITHGAYFVVSKKLNKDVLKICKSCGHKGEGSHKTCDNMLQAEIDSKPLRCNGEWEKTVTFSANTQLIIQEIPDHMGNMVLESYDDVIKGINAEIYPRNFSACAGRFGNRCDYYDLCHSNSLKNLICKTKKENNGQK